MCRFKILYLKSNLLVVAYLSLHVDDCIKAVTRLEKSYHQIPICKQRWFQNHSLKQPQYYKPSCRKWLRSGVKNAQLTSWAGMFRRKWGTVSPRRVGVSALHTNSRRRGSLFNQGMSHSPRFWNILALESGESFIFMAQDSFCKYSPEMWQCFKVLHGIWLRIRLQVQGGRSIHCFPGCKVSLVQTLTLEMGVFSLKSSRKKIMVYGSVDMAMFSCPNTLMTPDI